MLCAKYIQAAFSPHRGTTRSGCRDHRWAASPQIPWQLGRRRECFLSTAKGVTHLETAWNRYSVLLLYKTHHIHTAYLSADLTHVVAFFQASRVTLRRHTHPLFLYVILRVRTINKSPPELCWHQPQGTDGSILGCHDGVVVGGILTQHSRMHACGPLEHHQPCSRASLADFFVFCFAANTFHR